MSLDGNNFDSERDFEATAYEFLAVGGELNLVRAVSDEELVTGENVEIAEELVDNRDEEGSVTDTLTSGLERQNTTVSTIELPVIEEETKSVAEATAVTVVVENEEKTSSVSLRASFDVAQVATPNSLVDSAVVEAVSANIVSYDAVGVAADQYENDNLPIYATVLTVGETQIHSISEAGDRDWMVFTTGDAGSYTVMTTGGAALDIALYVKNTDGSFSKVAYASSATGLGTGARLSLTLAADATYYVMVEASNPMATYSSYGVRVLSGGVVPDVYEDYNDNIWNNASLLQVGTAQMHSIHVDGDIDWSTFKVAENGIYTVALSEAADMRLSVYTISSNGEMSLVGTNVSNDENVAGLAINLNANTAYYIKAEKNTSGTVGAYQMAVTAGAADVDAPADSFEVDNTQAEASVLSVDTIQEHTIHNGADIDWITFTTGVKGDLTVTGTSSAENLKYTYYKANDNGVLTELSVKTGSATEYTFSLEAGEQVYVKVESSDGKGVNEYSFAGSFEAYNAKENYIVIYSGGGDVANNNGWFYDNIRSIYECAINYYNIDPENIYIVYADGTNPGIDKTIQFVEDGTAYQATVNSDMTFATVRGSTVVAATREEFRNVLTEVGQKIDGNDNFLFYSFDHGDGSLDPLLKGEEKLVGWDVAITTDTDSDSDTGTDVDGPSDTTEDTTTVDNDVTAAEFASWVQTINDKVGYATYIFTECFSGGMIDALPTGDNICGIAAANHYETAWGSGNAEGNNTGGFSTAVWWALTKGYGNKTTYELFNWVVDHDVFACTQGPYEGNSSCTQGHDPSEAFEHPWITGGNFKIFA